MAFSGSKAIAACRRWWKRFRIRIKTAIVGRRKHSQATSSLTPSSKSQSRLGEVYLDPDLLPLFIHDEPTKKATAIEDIKPFRWWDLPAELRLEVIELLRDDYNNRTDWAVGDPHPLLHLSSTCKQLRNICAPHVFSAFTAPAPESDEGWIRFLEATTFLGKYVDSLTLEIYFIQGIPDVVSVEEENEKERRIHDVIVQLPLLQTLNLQFHRFDQRKHARFLEAISTMEHLRKISIHERGLEPDISFDDADDSLLEMLFFNDLLHHVLDRHGPTLEAISVSSALKLHPSVFYKLRDTTRSLRKLSLVHSIALRMRTEFAKEEPWACAGVIEQLTFHHCMGVHFGWFARNIGKGIVWGTKLKRVDLVVCGYPDDDEFAPSEWLVRHERIGQDPDSGRELVRSQWRTNGSVSDSGRIHGLDKLRIDHTIDWELSKMGSLPVKDLTITRCTRDIVLDLFKKSKAMADVGDDYQGYSVGGNIPFPGLQALHLAKYDADEDEELSVRCAERGIDIIKDGKAWDSCGCHKDG